MSSRLVESTEELEEVLPAGIRSGRDPCGAFRHAGCEFVKPHPLPKRVCRDKSDDAVLAAAVAGKADVIVTGDDAYSFEELSKH